MAALTQVWLPHIGASLVFGWLLVSLATKFVTDRKVLTAVFVVSFAASLIPFSTYNLSHFLRVLTGDLSIISFIVIGAALWCTLTETTDRTVLLRPAQALVAVAVVLYPTALGLTYFDLYAHGYYPIILGPVLFTLFAGAIWFEQRLAALLLAAGFMGYAFGMLESDNLWDYLVDPVIVIYSAVLLVRYRRELPSLKLKQDHIEVLLCMTIATFLAFAIFLAKNNHDAFQFEYVIEDGFIEWCTVLVLLATMMVCANRFLKLRKVRSPLFLTVTALLTLLCLFGAGEEISWGQRIFGLETPDYLKDRNAQGELGLHNLVIEIDGERVKLNKLIFGTGLAIALLIYLFVATPLYRRNDTVRRFFNAIAAPMPRNYHIVGYLLVVATVELLIDSSKRGEMTEFAGSIVFALNVIYPYNPELFDPEKELT